MAAAGRVVALEEGLRGVTAAKAAIEKRGTKTAVVEEVGGSGEGSGEVGCNGEGGTEREVAESRGDREGSGARVGGRRSWRCRRNGVTHWEGRESAQRAAQDSCRIELNERLPTGVVQDPQYACTSQKQLQQ